MAKKVRVAPFETTDWTTLPGSNAEFSAEAAMLDDTIFGASLKSMQPDMISWRMQSNAIYKGYSGYQSVIKKTGAAVQMTDEAMSLVSGKTYRVTDAAKRLLSPGHAIVVKEGAVDKNAQVEKVDYLFGTVTFLSSYTVTGAVTIDAYYLPSAQICSMNRYSLTQQADSIQNTDICDAQTNGGFHQHSSGLRSVSLDLQGFYKTTNAFLTALSGRQTVMIEINPDGAGKSLCRGFFKPKSNSQSGRVGALEEDKISYELFVPDVKLAGNNTDILTAAFSWSHDGTSTLNQGIQDLLTAWSTDALVEARYLEDGVAGKQGTAVVTNLSLAGGLNSLNEFSVQLTGSGAITAV